MCKLINLINLVALTLVASGVRAEIKMTLGQAYAILKEARTPRDPEGLSRPIITVSEYRQAVRIVSAARRKKQELEEARNNSLSR